MSKIKIQIKNRWTGDILFEYEKEDNTIRVSLMEAKKGGADLGGAYLRDAYLRDADLRGAYLRGADLRGAYLRGADLGGADLGGADLGGAYLRGADLRGADLRGAKNIQLPMACPSDGAFIGWKKVKNCGEYLVKLEIPDDAQRSSAITAKCRCSKAKVLAITAIDDGSEVQEVMNYNETPLLYKVGEIVLPDSYDENRWNECSHGIHFFVDKDVAINY